jgi:hypothetical protein
MEEPFPMALGFNLIPEFADVTQKLKTPTEHRMMDQFFTNDAQ